MLYETKKNNYLNYLLYFCICIPIFIFCKTVYHYALNIPREDDYDAFLSFLCLYKKSSFINKIPLLFTQQGEHRILSSKIITLIHYYIFGDINFRHLVLFNGLMLISIFIIIAYFIRKCLPGIAGTVAIFLLSLNLFDLNNYENADTVSAGLFNYSVILLFLLSMSLYSFKNKPALVIAAILQVICIYSGGNGMIAAFFIFLFTLFDKQRYRMITSGAIFIIFSPLYFYHFTNSNSMYFTMDITKALPVFFNALGANYGMQLGLITGISLFILLIIYLPIKQKFKINAGALPLLCIAGFMLTSLSVMSIFRGQIYATVMGGTYFSRYLVYSHTLIVMVFVFYFVNKKNVRILLASAIFVGIFYILNYDDGKNAFETIHTGMKTKQYYYFVENLDFAKQVAIESCNLNIYCIEKHRGD